MAEKELDFTQNWTTHHFTTWAQVLASLAGKERLRGLELGSFEGRSAIWFLQHICTHPTSKLVCVDLWSNKQIYSRFLANILAAEVFDRCETRKGDSHMMLRTMRQRFDFVYVDADHRGHAVLTDAVLAWQLLVSGGILIFDDYLWQKPGIIPPKKGLDAFLEVFDGQYEVLHCNWQLILRKL